MARFEMPQKMKQWSLWALWCLILGGSTLWLLVGSVAYWVTHGWLPADAAGWAQAIGSVLAVAGAAAFPYMHEAHRKRSRQREFRELLHLLVSEQLEMLKVLDRTILEARSDYGERSITGYYRDGLHLKWEPHREALRAIPINELAPVFVHILGELKVSAGFGSALAYALDDMNLLDDVDVGERIRQLINHQKKLGFYVKTLESSPNPRILG